MSGDTPTLLPAAQPADELRGIIAGTLAVAKGQKGYPAFRALVFGLTTNLIYHWLGVIPHYLAGDIEECEIRRYARRWGQLQVGAMRTLDRYVEDAPTDNPAIADAVRRLPPLRRAMFQAIWCPTEQTGHAYFILAPHSLSVKIGYTGNECAQRLLQLQTGTPEPLLLLGYMPANARYTELFLHEYFRSTKIRGEWFQFDSSIAEFIRWACDKRAPDITLDDIPEFAEDKWNCDPWPKSFPRTNKEIEAWLSQPALY